MDLYDTASSVLDNPLGQSIQDFSKVIQNYTNQIHKEVNERIGIDSRLSIPQNLSELFKTLIFQTVVEDRDSLIPLDMRGDGIQARHMRKISLNLKIVLSNLQMILSFFNVGSLMIAVALLVSRLSSKN